MKPRESEEAHSEVPATAIDSSQDAEASKHKRKQESPTKKVKSPPIGSAPGDLRSSPVKPPPKKTREDTPSDGLLGLNGGI